MGITDGVVGTPPGMTDAVNWAVYLVTCGVGCSTYPPAIRSTPTAMSILSNPSIVIVGSNHECASVDLRERLSFTGDTLAGGLRVLREHVDEGLIVSTCNRTELYVVTDQPEAGREQVFTFLTRYHNMPPRVLSEMSYVHADARAVQHIFRVASGLDSIVLGEPQILAQIRDALDAARSAGSVGPYLQRLATDALKVGKRARTDTNIARNNLSISHAAVDLVSQQHPDLTHARVTLIGAGKMASIAARVLVGRGVGHLTIVNRSPEKAEKLAAETGAEVRGLDELEFAISESDIVIAAVATDDPLIHRDVIGTRGTPLTLIDLGVPRIVDPACGDLDQVDVFSVDDLERVSQSKRQQYASEMTKVEELVNRATGEFLSWTHSRRASHAIGTLRRRSDQVRDNEVERALKRLGHLSERDQNVVRAMAKALTNTLMHEPVQSLRTAPSSDEVRGILTAFGIDPAEIEQH